MRGQIEVSSRDTIKPSSSTPHHLQNHQLSLLDQTSPPHYNGLIFFQSTNSSNLVEKSTRLRLKSSLSDSLTRFYPLAGRLVNNISINCNDEGTPYIEANSSSRLSDIIDVVQDINRGTQLGIILPRAADDFNDSVVLAIQVNFCECGGLAIGACFSHKVADAFSIIMFLNSWAATCRGESRIDGPIFKLAKLFPPSDKLNFLPRRPEIENKKEKIITKMFTFNSTSLETLRTMFSSDYINQQGDDPLRATRVEAASAFIWSRYMEVISTNAANSSPEKLYSMNNAVSLRKRASLESSDEGIKMSSESHFGNFYTFSVATPSMDDKGSDVVRRMRVASKNIDWEFVKMLREGDEYVNFLYGMFEKAAKEEMVSFSCSSWFKMPAYEVDFGWGKPSRVALGGMPLKNFVRFIDTKYGDGIEAWISMEEEEMIKLEADQDLVNFC